MNDTLSRHAQFQQSGDLIGTNANSEVGMFYQVTWATKKKQEKKTLGYFMLMNVNHQD